MWCSFYIGVIINPECGRASEKHAVLGEEDRMQSDQEAKESDLIIVWTVWSLLRIVQ